MTEQECKEQAVLLAIKQGHGLFRRGDKVMALYPNGEALLISTSRFGDTLWHDALAVLRCVEAGRPRRRDRIFGAVMEWLTQ